MRNRTRSASDFRDQSLKGFESLCVHGVHRREVHDHETARAAFHGGQQLPADEDRPIKMPRDAHMERAALVAEFEGKGWRYDHSRGFSGDPVTIKTDRTRRSVRIVP